jgi:hypothetical protein
VSNIAKLFGWGDDRFRQAGLAAGQEHGAGKRCGNGRGWSRPANGSACCHRAASIVMTTQRGL